MVNIDDKLKKIKAYVDAGYYFVINRARQYGKTTTLGALAEYLKRDYAIISLDFQMMSENDFKDETTFAKAFAEMFLAEISGKKCTQRKLSADALKRLETAEQSGEITGLRKLFIYLNNLCETAENPVVLMIDEVDSATNNQVFLDFLAQLRAYYLARGTKVTFQSVILAGVYDIKNLKLKLRPETEHKYNSPWNIAEPFEVDMSFSAEGIAGMLKEYAEEHGVEMDEARTAESIYAYTAGYPFLVSGICKTIDARIAGEKRFENQSAWSEAGVAEAVKVILKEQATLFDSLNKQLDANRELRDMLKKILFQGNRFSYNPYNEAISLGVMFGYLKEQDGSVVVANRIFEMWIYNLFLSEDDLQNTIYKEAQKSKNQFVKDGVLNMNLVLEKFVEHYTDVYAQSDEEFVERQGRKLFLLYLKPIINGTGNYYVEAETRDLERTDVIVDYLGQQFIIELKIWHGEKYNARGEEQLSGYLDRYHLKKGYMLTFSFNAHKETGIKEVCYEDKTIIEAFV